MVDGRDSRREADSKNTDESGKDDEGAKISGLQIAAASGAASTGALVANALGIYGTVGGVALFSVISSVGTVLYLKSMRRGRERIRKVVRQVNTTPIRRRDSMSTTPSEPPAGTAVLPRQEDADLDATAILTRQERVDPDATTVIARQQRTDPDATVALPGQRRSEDEATTVLPSQTRRHEVTDPTTDVEVEPGWKERIGDWWKRHWKTVTYTSLAAFVVSLVVLTGLAWVSGQPATSYYDGGSGQDSAPEPDSEPLPDEGTTEPPPHQQTQDEPRPEPSQTEDVQPGQGEDGDIGDAPSETDGEGGEEPSSEEDRPTSEPSTDDETDTEQDPAPTQQP